MGQQLKPIRVMHGTPNPSKALLLRLSVPQQLLHLTFEEGHSFIEREYLNDYIVNSDKDEADENSNDNYQPEKKKLTPRRNQPVID